MEPSHDQAKDSDIDEDARIGREMLARIGWSDSDLKQIEMYALMPPAKKVAIAFEMHRQRVRFLETQLRSEHPDKSDTEIFWLVQEQLDLEREDKTWW